jgi:hypothetical protein
VRLCDVGRCHWGAQCHCHEVKLLEVSILNGAEWAWARVNIRRMGADGFSRSMLAEAEQQCDYSMN